MSKSNKSGGRGNIVRGGRSNVGFKKSTVYTGPGSYKAKKDKGVFGSFVSIFTDGWKALDKKELASAAPVVVVFAAIGLAAVKLIPLVPVGNEAVSRMLTELLHLAAIWICSAVYSFVKKAVPEIADTRKQAKGMGLGLLYGLIWLGGVTSILLMYKVLSFGKGAESLDGLVLWVIALFARALMTELFAHGIVYSDLRRRFNFAVAAVYAAVVFLALNWETAIVNPYSFLTILFASVFFSAAIENSGTFITSITAYYIWICVGGLILGLVCLPADYPAMLVPSFTGSVLLTGGAARIEGSLITLVINIMFIFSFYSMWVKKYQEEHEEAEVKARRNRPVDEVDPDKVRIGGRVFPNVETHIGQKTRYADKSFMDKLKDLF